MEDIEYQDETLIICDRPFTLQTILSLPIELLASLSDAQDELSSQKVWTGSLLLLSFLLANEKLVNGRRLLELGCGSGLTSIALTSLLSPAAVLATDGDDRSLDILAGNIERNFPGEEGKAEEGTVTPSNERLTSLYLRWGEPLPALLFAGTTEEEEGEEEGEQQQVELDMIVAGDVLYKQELLEPFFKTLKELLSLPSSSSSPDGFREAFLCHIPRAGVTIEHVEAALEREGMKSETLLSYATFKTQHQTEMEEDMNEEDNSLTDKKQRQLEKQRLKREQQRERVLKDRFLAEPWILPFVKEYSDEEDEIFEATLLRIFV